MSAALDRVAEFAEQRDGVRLYHCNGCRRLIQSDNRNAAANPSRGLSDVLRHDGRGYCAACRAEIGRTGKPHPVGGPSRSDVRASEVPVRTGLCECGCGERTRVPKSTHRPREQYAGVPNRFVHGHATPRGSAEPAPVASSEPEAVWRLRAACRNTDRPEVFDMPDGWRFSDPTPEAEHAARRYCARCPVLDECEDLADELSGGAYPLTGLWAGEWRTTTGRWPIRTAGPIPALVGVGASSITPVRDRVPA